MRKFTTFAAALGLSLIGMSLIGPSGPVAAETLEDWQLSHGGFVTAADVRAHNALPQDRADMLDALAGNDPDWAGALAIYTWGRHFPWRDRTHSLGRFADDYNGAMPAVLPESVAHWGDPSFAVGPVYSALADTGVQHDDPGACRSRVAHCIFGATLAAQEPGQPVPAGRQ